MPDFPNIERLTLTGGNRPLSMEAEAHIVSNKGGVLTTAFVTLTIDISDDPTLSEIQRRILRSASHNLNPE